MVSMISVFVITLTAFLLVIAGMAVGVAMGRNEISGSCGGLSSQTSSGTESSCSLCENPDAACRELGRRMQGSSHEAGRPETLTADRAVAGDTLLEGGCEKDCVDEGCSKEAIDACRGS